MNDREYEIKVLYLDYVLHHFCPENSVVSSVPVGYWNVGYFLELAEANFPLVLWGFDNV